MTDQEATFRLNQLEKDLARQQRDSEKECSELKQTCEKLKEKIQALENTRTVVFVVAAIFGIAGAWGLNALQTAKDSIEAVQRNISNLQPQVTELRDNGTKPILEAARAATTLAKNEIKTEADSQSNVAKAQIEASQKHVEESLQKVAPRLQSDIANLQRVAPKLQADVADLQKWNKKFVSIANKVDGRTERTGSSSKSGGDLWVHEVAEEAHKNGYNQVFYGITQGNILNAPSDTKK